MTVRRTAEQSRREILGAAASQVRRNGYAATTLEDVGHTLGITRGAVLHHFSSKELLLQALVEPFMASIDQMIDEAAAQQPLTARGRRQLLTRFVDTLYGASDVAVILARDAAAQAHVAASQKLAPRTARVIELLSGPAASPDRRLRALCCLGAAVRPMTAPDGELDLADPSVRRTVVDSALAALRG